MKPSVPNEDLFSLTTLASAPDYGSRILEVLPGIGEAPSAEDALELFRRALRLMGADAGVFLSAIKDEAMHTSYRLLLACDPLWANEYARREWHAHDPWLRHAARNAEPIRGSELSLQPEEEEFVKLSERLGFASTVVAPAPSCAGTSRVGVLCIGSHNLGFFEVEAYRLVRVIAKALAMELHGWLLRTIRKDLLARSRITADELDLLRHEMAGHTSKRIASELRIEAKTVDSRFQHVIEKLHAPDRRTAARIASLYDLL